MWTNPRYRLGSPMYTATGRASPKPGTRLIQTDQDSVVSLRARWNPDDEITLEAYVDSPLGRVEDSVTFTAPRPTQPFPSWTWNGSRWEAPVAYPSDGQDYTWDESGARWILA